MNVAVGAPVVNVTVVGVNVPPPLPLLGVTTIFAPIGPFAPTVKFVDAMLKMPELGPDSVTAILVSALSPPPPPHAPSRVELVNASHARRFVFFIDSDRKSVV